MSNLDLTANIIYVIFIVISFVFGRYIYPKLPQDTKAKLQGAWEDIKLVKSWADKFIALANEESQMSGIEKMDSVVDSLEEICRQYDIDLSGDQLYAIAQECYNIIKHGGKLPHREPEPEEDE